MNTNWNSATIAANNQDRASAPLDPALIKRINFGRCDKRQRARFLGFFESNGRQQALSQLLSSVPRTIDAKSAKIRALLPDDVVSVFNEIFETNTWPRLRMKR